MAISYSELHSRYIIDGRRTEASPWRILESACGRGTSTCPDPDEEIIDESVDPSPSTLVTDISRIRYYILRISSLPRRGMLQLSYPETGARAELCFSLIDTIWSKGHFRLEDLCVSTSLKCSRTTVGARAALYLAVASLCDYLDCLGLRMSSYSLSCSEKDLEGISISIRPSVEEGGRNEEDDIYDDDPFTSGGLLPDEDVFPLSPRTGRARKCPSTLRGDEDAWVVFIPFDTCPFSLGDSLLSKAMGQGGGKAPDILDADYFMDCFEVVRELVEDSVALSGVSVGKGGLAMALEKIRGGKSLSVDLSGIMKSYGGTDPVTILFSEVPGVVIEISDSDYDYLDAELVLQDVAYYPIAHTGRKEGDLSVNLSSMGGVGAILQSLLDSQAVEGED